MIKKLMLLCVAAMVTMRTWAATEIVNGIEWVYEVSNDGIIVVEAFRNGEELPWALESDGVLAVPEKIGGYPVREIGDRFMPGGHDMTLKKVVLPNSIVKIGQSAFEGNNALSEINFPEGLRELSYKSFEECGLEKIIIPEGVTEIPENCFRQCYSLAEVYLPKSLKNIRMSAFEECPKLKAIHCAGEKPKLDPYALYKSPNAVFYSGVGVENYAVSAYVVDGCETMGKVTGGKAAKAGTKLTLKATANRGYVFAGWEGPLDGSQDPRNPSASYVVGEDDAEFVARFIPVEDDVAAISFTMSKEYENGVTIDSVSVDVSSCTSLPTVKVAGLPAGLKFTAKPIYKKGSKTEVEVPANTIYGTPTKSGVYTVVATVTTSGKKTATCSQTVMVVGLPDAIVGTFNGFVKAKDGEENIGTFQFVATDLGKLTAKVITSSGTYTFSATGWSSVEGSVYAVGMETPKGDLLRLSIDSLSRWDENQLTGVFKANGKSEHAVHAKRNAFGNSWYFSADGDAERGWTLSYVPNAILADIIVTLNADGSTKIAGALCDFKVSAAGYADVTCLTNGVIFADFAPVISVKNGKISSKRVLSLRTNLWFDRSNSHIEGVGSARFTE